MATKKMGPVVTDNNNFIIDFIVGELNDANLKESLSPQKIETQLKTIPGV